MCSNCNIPKDEFYSKYEIVDSEKDIYRHIKTLDVFIVIMEDDDYIIGRFL